MRRLQCIFVLIAIVLAAPSTKSASSVSFQDLQQTFIKQLRTEAQPANEYIVGKFREHDLVWIGEAPHNARQNLQFLQQLIAKLHAAGIRSLGYEMGLSEDQQKIDQLVVAPTFDQALVDELVFRWRPFAHSLRDYTEVYKAAWEVNRRLPAGVPRFRIVALDVPTAPTEWSLLTTGEKGSDPLVRLRWMEGNWNDRRDMHWARIIAKEILAKEEKALIYSGAGHSSTRVQYATGLPNPHWRSAGQLIYNIVGDRVFRLSLGGEPTFDRVSIDRLMAAFMAAGGRTPIGFDVRAGMVIGDMPSTQEGYLPETKKLGAARGGPFSIADLIDGYVYLLPRTQLEAGRPIPLTPELVREYNRLNQIRTGDRTLEIDFQEVQRRYQEENSKYRQFVEDRNAK